MSGFQPNEILLSQAVAARAEHDAKRLRAHYEMKVIDYEIERLAPRAASILPTPRFNFTLWLCVATLAAIVLEANGYIRFNWLH